MIKWLAGTQPQQFLDHQPGGAAMRVEIRVRPGSSRTAVGGTHGGALLVRVTARPVEGKATEAALRAVAAAFGVRRADVRLVVGPASRDKVVEIEGDPGALGRRLAALRSGTAARG